MLGKKVKVFTCEGKVLGNSSFYSFCNILLKFACTVPRKITIPGKFLSRKFPLIFLILAHSDQYLISKSWFGRGAHRVLSIITKIVGLKLCDKSV